MQNLYGERTQASTQKLDDDLPTAGLFLLSFHKKDFVRQLIQINQFLENIS